MIEIQCTSCHTRYRIDERVLPDDTPTFKCSRCGHVFNAEPLAPRERKPQRAAVRAMPSRSAPAEQAAPAPVRDEPAEEAPAAAAPEPEPPAAEHARGQEAAPGGSPTEELLNRSFRQSGDDDSGGENLSFDFSDDSDDAGAGESSSVEFESKVAEPEWQVGEPEQEPAPTPSRAEEPAYVQPPRPEPRYRIDDFALEEPAAPAHELAAAPPKFAAGAAAMARSLSADRGNLPEDVAHIAPRGRAHSSGTFLLMFFAVAVLFGAASTVICGTPIASARALSGFPLIGSHFARPIVPATLVALHGVSAAYQEIKSGETALVITGTAENVGDTPLHAILLSIDLLDDGGQRQLGAQGAYVGNGLSPKMIGEMTPREIEFLQRLDPQKSFVVPPSGSAPFAIVFIKPPQQVARLRIEVSKASPALAAAAPRT
jgi:predicted Zn finger-like uncharacterized protein